MQSRLNIKAQKLKGAGLRKLGCASSRGCLDLLHDPWSSGTKPAQIAAFFRAAQLRLRFRLEGFVLCIRPLSVTAGLSKKVQSLVSVPMVSTHRGTLTQDLPKSRRNTPSPHIPRQL